MHSSMCANTLSHFYGGSDSDDNRTGCETNEAADDAEAWWSVSGQAMSAEDRTGAEWWQEVAELIEHDGFDDAAATGVNHTHFDQGASTDVMCDDEWPF